MNLGKYKYMNEIKLCLDRYNEIKLKYDKYINELNIPP